MHRVPPARRATPHPAPGVAAAFLLLAIGAAPAGAGGLSDLREQPVAQKIATVQALRTQWLGGEDLGELLRWVNQPTKYDNAPPATQDLFFNELLETLLRHADVPAEDFAEALSRCLRDETRRVVPRDYALQHLGSLYERGQLPAVALEVVFEQAGQSDDALAATALRTLERVIESDGRIDRARVAERARAILREPKGPAMQRSALHLAATLKLDDLLPEIRAAVFGKETDPNIQMVGLYALGELGGERDLEALDHLERNDSRVSQALFTARRKLAGRDPVQNR